MGKWPRQRLRCTELLRLGHGGAAPALVLSLARPVLGGIGQHGTTGRLVRG